MFDKNSLWLGIRFLTEEVTRIWGDIYHKTVSKLQDIIVINRSKHPINKTQVMEQRIFSFGIKEQLLVMLQNVHDVEQKSAPALQQRLAYLWLDQP